MTPKKLSLRITVQAIAVFSLVGLITFGTNKFFQTPLYEKLSHDSEGADKRNNLSIRYFDTVFHFKSADETFDYNLAELGYLIKITKNYFGIEEITEVKEGFPEEPYQANFDCHIFNFQSSTLYVLPSHFMDKPFMEKNHCPKCENNPGCKSFYMAESALRLALGEGINKIRVSKGRKYFKNPLVKLVHPDIGHLLNIIRRGEIFYPWIKDPVAFMKEKLDKHPGDSLDTELCEKSSHEHPYVCVGAVLALAQRNPDVITDYLKRFQKSDEISPLWHWSRTETLPKKEILHAIKKIELRRHQALYLIHLEHEKKKKHLMSLKEKRKTPSTRRL